MRSQKKRIRHRDRNYMIYVLTFLIALTGILGISKGSPVLAAEEESTQKGSISIVCPVEGMEMPEIALEDLDGAACIGVLEIPAIDLKLPVLSEWSYPLLKKAPCRYSGSAYLDNLVIAAHNYRTHFGKLKELEMGDEVIFTDAAGNRFEYKVAAVEALTPQSVEDMTSGEWALSLFTCTLDGKNRVTVRCEKYWQTIK